MLQQWLHDRCVPVVATLVTEDADLACRKNNVSFEQLVSAFARMDGLKVPFRSSSQQYSLESFACRFVRGSSMRPSSARERDAPLADIAIRATEEESARAAAAAAGGEQGGVGAGAKATLLDSAIDDQGWYKRFRSRLWEDLCHQEHEMLDCPAAVLVVVSSTESSGDPVACFHELSSPRYLPPPFESKQYDPVSPALVYVLLHDWCQGAAQGVDPDRVLSQMRGAFTAGQCRLLCINSLPPDCPNLAQPDIWADKIHQDDDYELTSVSTSPSAGEVGSLEKKRVRGCCLSPEDLTVTKEFVHGLATQVVVPSMERRILDLNASVASVRKGVKNFMKSWLRKPRDTIDPYGGDAGGAGGSATYRFDRIESQIRLLADSAFLMRDYDTAISMYRMARDDFKSDRALLHYASASEMLAISLYLQQQGRVAPSVLSPGGSFASPHIAGGFSGAIGGVATAAATAAVTAAGAAVATGAVGVRDLSWHSATGVGGGVAGSSLRAGEFSVAPPPASSGGSSRAAGGSSSISISGHGQGAPNSSSGGFSGGMGINPSALLGRGREADAAFSAALEAYHRRAAEDSRGYLAATTAAARSGGGYYGGSGVPPFPPPSARLGARAALLFADVVSSTVEAYSTPKGLLTGGEELQTQAEEALLNASVHENSLCAAVLLEVSANRCRASGRLRRASFRLIQAGHMYKTFAKERVEALRRGDKEATEGSFVARANEDKSRGRYREHERERYFGMHAARCFLAALSGYQGSGWHAAEDYTCNALPTELCALQRPVAALQLYLRMLASREQAAAAAGRVATGGVRSARTGIASSQSLQLHQQQQQQQQQQQHKRAVREASLLRALGDLCWRYPDAARVAARAWERSRDSSRLDMSFFSLTERAKASPPPPPPSPTRRPLGSTLSPTSSKSRFPPTLDLDSGSGGGSGGGGVVVSKGQGDKGGVVVVFEGLALPGVVHEDTRVVNTENAALEAAIEVSDSSQWATGMAEALRAEKEATEAVRAGKGPWLTLAASCSHKAGSNSSANPRRPVHLPPPLRSAPVGEPVTVLVVLENHLSVAVPLKDMQLVLTSVGGKEGGEDEREEDVACVALDEEDFRNKYSSPPLSPMPVTPFPHEEATVVVERRRATVGPGERIPVLLKFCALRPAASRLTVSAVRWTVFHWSEEGAGAAGGAPKGGGGVGENEACPRVWISHRLEGRGKLLHGTLEQRAARARAPAPPPQFEATGSMPWLGCCLEGVPATLLQGESVKATLRITNRGRAPAGHLLLKTNVPWVAFEDAAAGGGGGNVGPELSGEATGGAFGASGTTLRPPVDEIMPGEVVLLPLWVRGRGGGRQTVRMLLRYKRARVKKELEEPPKPNDDVLFSLERHASLSMEMCVLPSLSVAASVLPSYSRRGEYVLSLEATNYRSNGDDALGTQHLRIHKVCAISRRWQMEPLAGFPNDLGGGGVEGGRGGVIVHWQERITLHYRLFPAKIEGGGDEHSADTAQGGLVAPPVRHSDCALGVRARAKGPGSADSPHLPLLCLEQASSNFYAACRKHRQQKLAAAAAAAEEHPKTIQGVRKERDRQRAIEALKKEEEEEKRRWRTQRHAHPTSPEALCAPDLSLVHLMVLWGLDGAPGKEPVRWGQHHVRSLVIRPERVERQCPLVLTVKYPSDVRWNSETHGSGDGQGQGCDADVTVCATNRLAGPGDDARVNFTFEVRADDGPRRLATVSGAPPAAASGGGQSSSNKRPPRNRFVWLGPTRRRVVGLGPGEATTIPLKVRFLRPGVFDLNRFRFIVEFAPPGGKDGKGQPNPTNLPASAQQSLSLIPSQQSTQQQRKDSSASQQGRVTFVFPAQYLVTVAAADLPVGGEGERQKGPAPAMEERVTMEAEMETETETRSLKGIRIGGGTPRSSALEEVVVA